VAVLRAYSLFLILSDNCLIAYPINVLDPQAKSDASRTAPQRLSGERNVRFFNACEMKGRDLVIYGKQEGLSSTFKVLEPVIQVRVHFVTCPPLEHFLIQFSRKHQRSRSPGSSDEATETCSASSMSSTSQLCALGSILSTQP
jgi:hypothetical protein